MSGSASKKATAIHGMLRERIVRGDYKLHDRLPTETELARGYACSVGTVSKAVALLVHEGLVERRQKTGTRVIHTGLDASATPSAPVETGAFAFIYPSAQHESSWEMMQGFQAAAKVQRRRMVTLEIGADCQRQTEYLSRLPDLDVCGAVISPFFLDARRYASFCTALVKCTTPVVLVGTQLQHMDVPAVFFDAFHAGYTATRHLIDSGAKRIGFLCLHAASARSYFNGYRWALEECGLDARADRVLRETSMHPNYDNPMIEPELIGERYLALCGHDVDSVVCTQDYLAMGVIRTARKLGRVVPDGLRVVGVDGLESASAWDVPVTSYRFPFDEAGEKSFQILNAIVSGDTAAAREVRLRGNLIRRVSA